MYKFFLNKSFSTKEEYKKKFFYEISHHSKNKLFKTSLGNKNKNKTFFIIKRTPGGGFFSNFIFVVKWISYARKMNYIPIVDMENFPTKYNEKKNLKNINNVWELYFNQISNFKLKDVYKSKNIIFCKDRFSVSLNDYLNSKLKKTFINNIKIKKEILNEANYFFKKKLKNNKDYYILGIHLRGTDQKITPGHYLPPTIFDIKILIEKKIKEKKKLKIFLVTEEKRYFEELKKNYKNYIYYMPSFRANKISDFNTEKRKYHRNKLGLESLREALVLSFCDEIVYCKSNIPLFSFFVSKKKITNSLINYGLNSYNPIFSYFKWKLTILPISFFRYLFYRIF
tara:strand:- start:5697 stop:6716 length:1020 start_codon:yes stop_codon:yes gene_type:complete